MGDGTLLSMLRYIRVTATETAQIARLSFVAFQLGTKEFEVALSWCLSSKVPPQRAAHPSRCFICSGRGPGTTHAMVQVVIISRTPRCDCSHLCQQQEALEIPVPTQYRL